jgi:hypothetical protein
MRLFTEPFTPKPYQIASTLTQVEPDVLRSSYDEDVLQDIEYRSVVVDAGNFARPGAV